MPRIIEMYAFVVADKAPDDEGIIGMHMPHGWMPFVGADMERVKTLIPYADKIERATGKKYKILKFHLAEEIKRP